MGNNPAKGIVVPHLHTKHILPGIFYKEMEGFIPDWIQGAVQNLQIQNIL
jgi:hypothetical protein